MTASKSERRLALALFNSAFLVVLRTTMSLRQRRSHIASSNLDNVTFCRTTHSVNRPPMRYFLFSFLDPLVLIVKYNSQISQLLFQYRAHIFLQPLDG